jgi:hypothetical protein
MEKLILISIIVATITIPAIGASRRADKGLQFTVTAMSVFIVFYFFLIIYIMPKFMV